MRKYRALALLAVLAMLATAHWLGVLERFSSVEGAKSALLGLGVWGYAAFVAAYTVLQPFGVPGTVFIMVAPLVWPWPVAFTLSMMGTMAASVVGFSFARFMARDWVASKIPARFSKYDEALAQRAFMTVFTLRFVFWMPQVLHWFLGVSKVGFWTHFWGSLAGYVVPIFLVSYFGQAWFEWLSRTPVWIWLVIVGAAVVVGVAFWARARRSR